MTPAAGRGNYSRFQDRDAKKTHVLILHKLAQIEKRLDRLERAARDAGGVLDGP